MPYVKLPGGGYAIVCTRGGQKRCVCGRPSEKLCDFPLTGAKYGKTCDRPLCRFCAVHSEPDTDYCQPHATLLEKRKAEADVK